MQNCYTVGVQNSFSLLLDEGADSICKAKGEKPDKKCKPKKSANKSKPAIAKNPLGETEKPVSPEPPKEDKSAKPAANVFTATGNPVKAKKKKRAKFIPPKKPTIGIPDEKMISFSDYMERHCVIRKKPDYNLRQAGEGEDPTQWKNLVPLKNKKHNPEDEMPPIPQRVIQKPPTPEPKMQRSPVSRKKHLNIPVTFGEPSTHKLCQYPVCTLHNEPPEDTQIPPKVDDDDDFPSLGN